MVKSKKPSGNATLENVQLGFRNFSGLAGQFNAEGDRNFHIFLDPDIAETMIEDGWNVKHLKPRDDQEDPQAHLKVKVKIRDGEGARNPRFYVVTSKNKTAITPDMVSMLDWVDIKFADVIINPYHYEINGREGVTAYLSAIYVNILEDRLHEKYAAIPDSAQSSVLALETSKEEDLEDLGEIVYEELES